MPAPRFHVLAWNQPLTRAAVAWLTDGWHPDDGPLDLAGWLLVVPTRQAGRRLREALAAHAAKSGRAVFPPRVLPPEQLVTTCIRCDEPLASEAERLLAWIEVLRSCDLATVTNVFPVEPPARTFTWASRLAHTFLRLQATLAEDGLRMSDVNARAGDAFPDMARWDELGRLEAAYDAALASRGLRDPGAARITALRSGAVETPAGVSRIALIGTPDPLPLAIDLLGRIADAGTVPVDVVVAGPNGEPAGSLFDSWGRPQTEAWAHRELTLPNFDRQVHVCRDPADQAAMITRLATAYHRALRGPRQDGACCPQHAQSGLGAGRSTSAGLHLRNDPYGPDTALALGVADPELTSPLSAELETAGLSAWSPEGRPRCAEPLYHLLATLAELVAEPLLRHVEALARCPDMLEWLRLRNGAGFSPARFLEGLDELHLRYLPATLATAREHAVALEKNPVGGPAYPELPAALEAIDELRGMLTDEPFPANIRSALGQLFARRNFNLEDAAHARLAETAAAWMDSLAAIETATGRFSGIEPCDAWDLALQAFGDTVRFDPKPAGALDLQGWLELAWEDAPHLAVAGLNDGLVPSAIVGDAFLPEALRERLGLKTNATRLSRDAYLLHVLAATRVHTGRLDLLFGKTSENGDPLRPSRLLFACDDSTLPGRVRRLFRELPAEGATVPWHRTWQLAPAPPQPITRLSVTAFRAHLACPLRFYLKHGLHMEAVDAGKAELDAFDFGILCHDALEAMAKDSRMRECRDAGVLADFLTSRLERTARARYGPELSLPLLVQLESARQRLTQAAIVQAGLRTEGWVNERVEWKFELPIGPIVVVGKIDRIDRHESTGSVRVLDYKTSDKPSDPRSAHVRPPGRNEDISTIPEHARFELGGETLIWKDLQLPLYLRALRTEFGADLTCGYFNLPKATGETAVLLWDGYDETWAAAAERCADGVIEAIATGRFWPPAELDEREDDFAALFHHGTSASMCWPGATSPGGAS